MATNPDNVRTLRGQGTSVAPPPGGEVTGDGQGVQHGLFGPLDTPEVRAAIVHEYAQIAKLENKRADINAKIKARREGLVNRGLNRKAIQDGVKLAQLNDAQRLDYDRSYMIARAAMNAEVVIHPPPMEEDDDLPPEDGDPAADPPAH